MQSINVFLAYAHEDEKLLEQLQRHLSPLIRPGLINIWYDRVINAGEEWHQEIKAHLDAAHLILLLVSPHFVHSEYCYSIEMKRAIERHERGEARVIPIILRPVVWQGTPFGKLQALPKDAKPVTRWPSRDDGFFDIVSSLKYVIEHLIPSEVALLQPRGRYIQSWDGVQPGCLIFLLDQSASMAGPFGSAQSDTNTRKCDMAATVINDFLSELISVNSVRQVGGNTEVRPRAEVAILSYSDGIVGPVLGGELAGKSFLSLPELQMGPLSIELRKKKEIDEIGQVIDVSIPFPIWVKPKARGDAPIDVALLYSRRLAEQWIATHQDNYPPVVINITDGIGSVGDLTNLAHQLCQTRTTDGQVLLYNVHITSLNYSPVDYPASEAELPDDSAAKQLFSISSIIPEPNRGHNIFSYHFPR